MRTTVLKLATVVAAFALLGGACGGDDDDGHDHAHDDDEGTQGSAQAEAGKKSEAAGDAAAGKSGSSGSSATAGAAALPTVDDGALTFTNVYTFTLSLCRNDTCHGKGVGGLNLANYDAAYSSLVDQPATAMGQCGTFGKKRVVPGDAENSLLFLKLFGETAPCGQQMPPGGQLPADKIQRVKDWIAMGAKKD